MCSQTLHAQDLDTVPLLKRFIPAAEIAADFQELERWILDTHPTSLTADSLLIQGAMQRAANQLRMGAPNWMVARVMGEAMATLGDSHVGLDLYQLKQEMEATWGRFPGTIALEGGLITVESSSELPVGLRIDSVGHSSARSILENGRSMLSSEGFARQTHYRRAQQIWPWIAAAPWSPKDVEGMGRIRSMDTTYQVSWRTDGGKDQSPRLKTPPMALKFIQGVPVLEVRSFHSGKEGAFKRKLRRWMREIRKHHPNGFVLDLRGNSGGLASRMEHLAQYLMSSPECLYERVDYRHSESSAAAFSPDFAEARSSTRQHWAKRDRWAAWRVEVDALEYGELWSGKLRPLQPHLRNFNGPVALIVDGGTASTAGHLAMWAAHQDNITTVGEPALVGNSGTGAHAASHVLQHSNLPVRCSTMRIWVNPTEQWNTGTWMPEVITPRAKALETAIDILSAQ